MAVTPPTDPRDDRSAEVAFDCPGCGRLRVRVDRPGNRVEFVCPECEPDALPGDLVSLDA